MTDDKLRRVLNTARLGFRPNALCRMFRDGLASFDSECRYTLTPAGRRKLKELNDAKEKAE